MLVERRLASLSPDLWIASRMEAAEHHGIVSVKVVEDEVWEPGHERSASRAVQDRLSFRVPSDQVKGSGHRVHESISRLHTALPIPAPRISNVVLSLRGEPNVHS